MHRYTLMDHLHVPDKEVFEQKAKVNALTKQLQIAEDQRDEALRVAATADARAKAVGLYKLNPIYPYSLKAPGFNP